MARTLLRPAQRTELSAIIAKKSDMKAEMFANLPKKSHPTVVLLHMSDEVCRDTLLTYCTLLGYHVVISQDADLKK